ncbi:MAG: hypothetical protein GY765_34220 [bacterium]|nr:hypothetical protein [bacterium]
MNKSGRLYIAVAFFFAVNFAVSSTKSLFAGRLIYFSFLVLLFFLLRHIDLGRILKTAIAGTASIIFIYGILQKFVLFPRYLEIILPGKSFYSHALIARIKSGRIFAIFTLPTLYAIVCTVFILFILHYLLTAPRKQKFFWAGLLVLGLINLALTQSFGGILYLSVGMPLYLIAGGIIRLKYLGPVFMILTLFLSLIIALRFAETKKLAPIKLRFSNWTQAARVIESSPFLGVGLGNYESDISAFVHKGEAKSIYAHNFFLQFTAESGIIIPFFLLILLFFSRKKLKSRIDPENKEKILYIAVFAVLVVYNIIDIGFYYFPAGITGAIVLSQLYRRTSAIPDTGGGAPNGRAVSLLTAALLLLAIPMVLQHMSDNYGRDADFLINQRQLEDAEAKYKKSISFNPFNFRSMMGCANLYLSTGNYREAETYVDKALDIYPHSSFAHYQKSRVLLGKRQFAGALFHAARAHRENPEKDHYRTYYTNIKEQLEKQIRGNQ